MSLDEYFKTPGEGSITEILIQFKKEFDELKYRVERLEKYKEIVKVGMDKLHNIKGLT